MELKKVSIPIVDIQQATLEFESGVLCYVVRLEKLESCPMHTQLGWEKKKIQTNNSYTHSYNDSPDMVRDSR